MKKIFIILIVLEIFVVGCAKNNAKGLAEIQEKELIENFLYEVFDLNKQQRCNTFIEMVGPTRDMSILPETEGVQEISNETQQAYENYCKPFEAYATQKCIDLMQANRIPIQYDLYVVNQNVTVEIADVQYEKVSENTYSFEVSYKTDLYSIKGKITIEKAEGKVLVTSVNAY